MRKLIKILAIIAAVLLIIYISASLLLNVFIKPEVIKNKITSTLQQKLGRPITVADGIHWSVFPHIGLKLKDVQVGNPATFNERTFIEAQAVKLSVGLLPLLTGKIEVSSITIDGITVHLIKNAQGKTNWENIAAEPSEPISTNTEQNKIPTVSNSKNLALTIASLAITNGTLIWDNQQTNQKFVLQKLELHSKDINFGTAFPLKLSFLLTNSNANSNELNFNLDTKLLINPAKGLYTFTDLISKLGETKVKGNASFKQAKISDINFNLNIDQIDLDTYKTLLSDSSKSSNSPSTNSKQSTTLQTPAQTNRSALAFLNDLTITGSIDIGKLTINKLKLQGFHAGINNTNGQLKLAPITAKLYQGNLDIAAAVDARSSTPRYTVNSNITNIQLGHLLKDLMGKSAFNGITTVNINITTQGEQKTTLLKSLNGNAKLAINDGVINGIDIFGLVRQAIAFIKSNAKGNINLSNVTHFTALTGNAIITNGIAKNNDLLLKSENLTAKGAGTINLITEQLNYRIIPTAKLDEKNSVDIPINITGSLTNPQAAIDFADIAKGALKNQLHKQIEKQLGKPIDDMLRQLNVF